MCTWKLQSTLNLRFWRKIEWMKIFQMICLCEYFRFITFPIKIIPMWLWVPPIVHKIFFNVCIAISCSDLYFRCSYFLHLFLVQRVVLRISTWNNIKITPYIANMQGLTYVHIIEQNIEPILACYFIGFLVIFCSKIIMVDSWKSPPCLTCKFRLNQLKLVGNF